MVGDTVAFAAEPAAERLLAEPLTVLPGVGDDARGIFDEPAVLLRALACGGRQRRAGRPGAGNLTGCRAVDAADRGGHAGGDQGGDGGVGGIGGGVVEPGEVLGAGEDLDQAEYLGGDGLVGEPGAEQRGVGTALGQPGGYSPGPGCPALRE